jgi:hypothetical protein
MSVPSFDFGVDVMPHIVGPAQKRVSRANPERRCGFSATTRE